MAQAIEALSNLIREGLPRRINMAEHGTRKHKLIRALLGMKHSPAGKKYLAKEKKRTRPVYYTRGLTTESKLRNAKMDEKDIKKMVGAKNYIGP